jgi:CDP-glucose 4,6-dehydratase
MIEDLKLFSGKRVLLTGDTGFKGSWLAYWLSMLGADVVGYALPPEIHQRLFADLNLSSRIHHIDGDIRDEEKMLEVFSEFKPEIVFHLAAQPLVRYSYDEPKETFEVNVQGSVNVLECVRKISSIKAFIYVTSDKCYQNNEWLWGYRETDRLGGHDPYSASKAAAEIVFSSYRNSFFDQLSNLGVASVRAGNVIGGGDWSLDRIVPDTVRSLKNDEAISVRNPHAVRPWQHVLEPLSGYMLLAIKLFNQPKKFSGSWNFGPANESVATVETLIKKSIDVWGSGKYQVATQKNAPHEAGLLTLNCDKAHHLLSWRPAWNFDQAVEKTISWYKETLSDKACFEKFTTAQIEQYVQACSSEGRFVKVKIKEVNNND